MARKSNDTTGNVDIDDRIPNGGDSNGADNVNEFDTGIGNDAIETADTGTQPKKRRGRVAGTASSAGTASKKNKALGIDRKSFAQQLSASHAILALMVREPALTLKESEAESLSSAVADVLELYEITVSRKMLAWVGLLSTATAIYTPKAVAIYAKRQARKPVVSFDMPIEGANQS